MDSEQQRNNFFERPFFAVGLSEKLMPVEMPVGSEAKEVAPGVLSLAAAGCQVMVVGGWKLRWLVNSF
jgi:hypothetical protein